MKPDPQQPADLLALLRQQLLLAQVRLMELEDARDELLPQLEETARLLAAAQTVADRQTDAAAHATKVHADLQAEFVHLRHIQHVTNEALNAVRAELAGVTTRAAALEAEVQQFRQSTAQQAATLEDRARRLADLDTRLAAAESQAAARLERINELGGELAGLKASRSWRWTAWLRGLERRFK